MEPISWSLTKNDVCINFKNAINDLPYMRNLPALLLQKMRLLFQADNVSPI